MSNDVLRMGCCCVCKSRGRLSDLGVCLSCHARACAVAEALREWAHFLRVGLEDQGEEATPDAEELRDSLGGLAEPLGELCRVTTPVSPGYRHASEMSAEIPAASAGEAPWPYTSRMRRGGRLFASD
jgi:hypothetical protein